MWGTTYIVTTELLPEGRPLLAATLRALPAGLTIVATTPDGAKQRIYKEAAFFANVAKKSGIKPQ